VATLDPLPSDPVECFRLAAAAAPGRPAVRAHDGELDFAELDRWSAGLADALTARGIGSGDLVGVGLHRGLRLVVALLAVWRAGAAYLPLDPHYPRERLEYMLADAHVRTVIATAAGSASGSDAGSASTAESGSASTAESAPESESGSAPDSVPAFAAGVEILDPDAHRSDATRPAEHQSGEHRPAAHRPAATQLDPPRPPGALDPAYVIYTSGSTGRPKGVLVPRGAVAHLLSALEQAGVYPAEPRVVGWNASVSFDASVKQWLRVCRGDTVVVLDEERRTDADALTEFLAAHRVQDLDLTPSHWELMRNALPTRQAVGGLPRLLIGGEPVPTGTWQEIAAASAAGRLEAVNLYGPTECTVDATAGWIAAEAAAEAQAAAGPHIGRALPGTRTHVLDEALRPVGPGETGELYLAGAQVALGYVHRPGPTAERFVADPFSTGRGARMYRTGDRVRPRADGVLEFVGRVDRQVKVRGHRVELGEVEAAVAAHPDLATAVATIRRGELTAYYVARRAPEPDGLRTFCAQALPEHLVPSVFVEVEAIALTANGKVDYDALPDPEPAESGGAIEPSGRYEELIAEVWAEVLDRRRVGADDDFFALGGHSLVALRVVARLKRELGLAVPTREVYRHPRLRDLAAYVEAGHAVLEGSRS
jgi:amino acid adenylation domain-containing protein